VIRSSSALADSRKGLLFVCLLFAMGAINENEKEQEKEERYGATSNNNEIFKKLEEREAGIRPSG